MYLRDIPHLPKIISRREFVEIIFDLGLKWEYGCDTLIMAVQIGDRFVSCENIRKPYTRYKKKYRKKLTSEQLELLTDLVPQVYSKELAYVVFVISSNYNEDWGYCMEDVANELSNGYVYKMQWEVCMVHNFYISRENFFTHLFSLIDYDKYNISGMFWDLTRHVCMNKSLLYSNPSVIISAIIILARNDRLRAKKDHRERIFQNIIMRSSQEYEIPLDEFLQAYIKSKSMTK
jgi:hypothetical protein